MKTKQELEEQKENNLMPVFFVFIEGLRAAGILDKEDIQLKSMGYVVSWRKETDED